MDSWIQPSSVVTMKASISSDQPAATKIGMEILRKGGNAADAAVAAMLAVCVLQPLTCGIGGDTQVMFFRNSDKSVHALNGSGRTGKNSTLDKIKASGITSTNDEDSAGHVGLWVSVPGTVAAIFNTIKHFGSGKLSMEEILEPVVKLAEEGSPLTFKHSELWHYVASNYKSSKNAQDFDVGGRTPDAGDIIRAPKLARFLKDISEFGPQAYYSGQRTHNIVKAVQEAGGVLTEDDFADYLSDNYPKRTIRPLSVDFHGVRVWEMQPNTIGIVALVAFNILKAYDLKALGHNSAEYIHLVSEAIKYAYKESWDYICDPEYSSKNVEELLREDTAQRLRNKIDFKRATPMKSFPPIGGDTSYLAVVDEEGNGCSFICSVSSFFGSGIIPDDCGFFLHDRARCMSLEEDSPNVYGPRKLPLHTIVPALVTDPETDHLLAVMGVVGRFMQPAGHVQVLINMRIFGMEPQEALNQPRFFVGDPEDIATYTESLDLLCLEKGINPSVVPSLESKGHVARFMEGFGKYAFGFGHVVARPALFTRGGQEVWYAGADPRNDGVAMGY